MSNSMTLKQMQLDAFFRRISQQQQALLAQGKVCDELSPFISFEDLKMTYEWVLKNKNAYYTELNNVPNNIQAALRIAKTDLNLPYDKAFFLPRTLNFIRDLDGQYLLILETKSKVAAVDTNHKPKKDPKTPKYEGGHKSGKAAWRIDSPVPEKWINLRTEKSNLKKLQDKQFEVLLSHDLANKAPAAHGNKQLFNVSLAGEIYVKNVLQKDADGKVKNVQVWRQGYYSPYALGNLEDILNGKVKLPQPMTKIDHDKIARDLLKAVKIMHDQGKVHQDIKPSNILIYWDNKNGYSARLTDFGNASKYLTVPDHLAIEKIIALATIGNESPEIHYFNRDSKAQHHNHFCGKYFSYARHYVDDKVKNDPKDPLLAYLATNESTFKIAHPSNDMWALGVVLFHLYKGYALKFGQDVQAETKDIPFVGGMLHLWRTQRLACVEALEMLNPQPKPIPPAVAPKPIKAAKPEPQPVPPPKPPRPAFLKPVAPPVAPKPLDPVQPPLIFSKPKVAADEKENDLSTEALINSFTFFAKERGIKQAQINYSAQFLRNHLSDIPNSTKDRLPLITNVFTRLGNCSDAAIKKICEEIIMFCNNPPTKHTNMHLSKS